MTGTAALDKGLELFNRIAADRGQTALAALAADMNLPRSTLYRLTGVLERAGMIARITRSHFSIGIPLARRLQDVSVNSQIAAASRPHLQRLATLCQATAHLGVMDNDMVTYLVKASAGTVAAVPYTQENAQLEAYCSGIGKVLLAWLPEAERERYLAGGPFVRLTDRTITDPAALAAALQTVRAARFARDDLETADHVYCLAVPLWSETLPMTAAISLSFSRPKPLGQRLDDAEYIGRLRGCAAAISRCLGCL